MGCISKLACSLLFVFLIASPIMAGEGAKQEGEKTEASVGKKFEPGSFIFEHIGDAYSWHIVTINHKHYSIPLLVIVYSSYSGWNVFLSSKLHNGEVAYHNFTIAESGAYKGKIVEILPNNQEAKPFDISITKNVCALFISLGLLLWIFLSVTASYKKNPNRAPKGIQSFMEPLILFVRDDIAIPSIGEHKYEKYMPYLLSIFFFILINNAMGLIPIFPGGANVTGNIAITLILALCTFVITTFSGNKHYWLEIFNPPGVPWWLKLPIPLIPFIELIGVFIKPFVLMVRLFANITAGHVIALGFFSLIFIFGAMKVYLGYSVMPISILFTFFMSLLELLVAFIQAYVFTLLSALYFGMALEEEHH
jgi:F-type H+-transporting ATPase subunit a